LLSGRIEGVALLKEMKGGVFRWRASVLAEIFFWTPTYLSGACFHCSASKKTVFDIYEFCLSFKLGGLRGMKNAGDDLYLDAI